MLAAARRSARLAAKVPRSCRCMCDKPGAGAKSELVSAPPAMPTPKPQPAARPGSSLWQRLVAFTVGVGAASAYNLYTLQADVRDATNQLSARLGQVHDDVASANASLRGRVRSLEQAVEDLRAKQG